jgi:ParB family chromosome partitioning protein
MVEIVEVSLDCIHPNPFQTRRHMNPSHVEKLAASIEQMGLQEPPQARALPLKPGHYELVFGHTRFAAFRLLHKRHPNEPRFARMPLYKVRLTDRQMFEGGVAENIDRQDISCIERAVALKTYIEKFNATQKDCGRLFGLTQGAVSNLLRLLRLPQPVVEIVQQGILPERSARMLVNLAPEDAIRIAKAAAQRDEDVRSAYVERCARESRGLANGPVSNDRPSIKRINAGEAVLGEDACPCCWKRPKSYVRVGRVWRCGECDGVVQVSVLMAAMEPKVTVG